MKLEIAWHKMIISPGIDHVDLREFTRQLMGKLEYEMMLSLWREYSRPIQIDYGQSKTEPVEYTWQSSLQSLRQLERDYRDGDKYVRGSVTSKQFEKLQQWIRHRYAQNKKIEAQAADIKFFELTFTDDSSKVIDQHSDVRHLKQLRNMHESSEIFLHDHELVALERWIDRAEQFNQAPQPGTPRPRPKRTRSLHYRPTQLRTPLKEPSKEPIHREMPECTHTGAPRRRRWRSKDHDRER